MINKKRIKVTMSLEDYEYLDWYVEAYEKLRNKIKNSAYINQITSDGAEIVIRKTPIEDLVIEYLPDDVEFDGIEDAIKITWNNSERIF